MLRSGRLTSEPCPHPVCYHAATKPPRTTSTQDRHEWGCVGSERTRQGRGERSPPLCGVCGFAGFVPAPRACGKWCVCSVHVQPRHLTAPDAMSAGYIGRESRVEWCGMACVTASVSFPIRGSCVRIAPRALVLPELALRDPCRVSVPWPYSRPERPSPACIGPRPISHGAARLTRAGRVLACD
jgi:hypothetical protein